MVEYTKIAGTDKIWIHSTKNTAGEQDAAFRKIIAENPELVTFASKGDQIAFNSLVTLARAELEGLDYDPVLMKEGLEMYIQIRDDL